MSSSKVNVQSINFSGFFFFIEEALEQNQIHANKLIKEKDKPAIVLMLQTYLIRACGIFSLNGYCKEGDIKVWFNQDVLIEEFDDLYLKFRDFLVYQLGLDLTKNYALSRYKDNFNFILYEVGDDHDQLMPDCQFVSLKGDCEPLPTVADPFL
ncbi:hypothetical protein [Aeromonas phage ZPAH34]|uniref:hypothetical protein n=1 Tax=Aeromonas phage ZPAH34 TaxID=2924888 RepID=UPI0023292102|nr:hypothetical protein PQD16_gp025 [Aeromonas phage ZPAH34]UOX39658.1 hypothetical protein [Aeromonas phage ZPAH34]